ncbi:MAG: PilZ domain-containing protein [Minicystis sp.]
MERRISSRAQVDVPICALVDGFRHACRAVDLSPTGMVVERPRALLSRDLPQVSPFELYLGEGRPIRARARPVWSRDRLVAVRFVWMNDADRLTIAELLDRKVRLHEPLH